MRRLKKREGQKQYIFHSYRTGRKLKKFSGDEVSDQEIAEFEVPEALLDSKEEKTEEKNAKSKD